MLKTIATLTIVHMAVSSCFVSGHNRSNDVINASITDSNTPPWPHKIPFLVFWDNYPDPISKILVCASRKTLSE